MVPAIQLKTHNRGYVKSSSFYMAVLFTLLCGLTVLMLAYFGYYFARAHYVDGTESIIDTEIKYIAQYPEFIEQAPHDPERVYAKFGTDGSRPSELADSVSLMTEGIIVFDHTSTGRRFAGKIYTDPQDAKILIGVDITEMEESYNFMIQLTLIGIVMVLCVIIVSFMISVYVVRGTNEIANTACNIMRTGDLSRRITVHSHWDDLGHMADTLNMLFDRIEQLMQGVRQVSDNIAHDLRTPLTRMKALIDELSKNYPDDPAVHTLATESDRMLSIFSALLRISRLESEQSRSHFQNTDLGQILKDALEFYEPMAQEKSITITHHIEPSTILGDRDLLFQAYANILDNAIKYTPDHGQIAITMKTQESKKIIEIYNTSAPLTGLELSRIFERFYRGESCRSTSGTGLGLSLTQAIIKLHNGDIYAENRANGLSIITIF